MQANQRTRHGLGYGKRHLSPVLNNNPTGGEGGRRPTGNPNKIARSAPKLKNSFDVSSFLYTMCILYTSCGPKYDFECNGKCLPTYVRFLNNYREGMRVYVHVVGREVTFTYRLDKLSYGYRGLSELRKKINLSFLHRKKLKAAPPVLRPCNKIKFVKAKPSVAPTKRPTPARRPKPPPIIYEEDRCLAYSALSVGTRHEGMNLRMLRYVCEKDFKVEAFKVKVPSPATLALIMSDPILRWICYVQEGGFRTGRNKPPFAAGYYIFSPKILLERLPNAGRSSWDNATTLQKSKAIGFPVHLHCRRGCTHEGHS
jgi:hypothetical protein